MAKISTPKTSVPLAVADEQRPQSSLITCGDKPSEQVIRNILNYSKALEVHKSAEGKVIAAVMN